MKPGKWGEMLFQWSGWVADWGGWESGRRGPVAGGLAAAGLAAAGPAAAGVLAATAELAITVGGRHVSPQVGG